MAAPPVTEMLEIDDVQGLILRGYGPLQEAQFLLLQVTNDEHAREYLRRLADRVNLGNKSPEDFALQIAFTAKGLAALGVPDTALATFSREFLEGMDDDVRAQMLGDQDDNASKDWIWGKRDQPIHALLMVYAKENTLSGVLSAERDRLAAGFSILFERETTNTKRLDQKEHFGWRDGISMPQIANVPEPATRTKEKTTPVKEWWTDPMPAGEFVLGYKNDYDAYTEIPTVDPNDDPYHRLPTLPGDVLKSLGRNGTYLVYREMTQDVRRFWRYLADESREPGNRTVDRAIALGAKMVGRWPNGAPLVTATDRHQDAQKDANEFLYTKDTFGTACPRGAHIRRASPRDVLALEDRGHDASKAMVRKHQMIRRGRAFGPPVVEKLDTEGVFAAREPVSDDATRGLHFICLVGNISRQFEFVQRAWMQSANFDALYKDGDPLIASRRPSGHKNQNDEFTCPAEPLRRKYKNLPPITKLVGGGYFFLPGKKALQFIARQP